MCVARLVFWVAVLVCVITFTPEVFFCWEVRAGTDGTEKLFGVTAEMQQVGKTAMSRALVQLMKVFNTCPRLGVSTFVCYNLTRPNKVWANTLIIVERVAHAKRKGSLRLPFLYCGEILIS